MSQSPLGTCTGCGTPLVPVLYGHPSPGQFEAAMRAEVVLGGCLIADNQPLAACPRCESTSRSAPAGLPRTVAEAFAQQPRPLDDE